MSGNASAAGKIALKSGLEIFYGYSSATGVPTSDNAVALTFRRTNDRLPVRGELSELSSTMQLAAIELSGAFCRRLVEAEALLAPTARRFFSDVNFELPADQLSGAQQARLFQRMARRFWQREATVAEIDALSSSYDAAPKIEHALQSVCVTFSTSLGFLVKR